MRKDDLSVARAFDLLNRTGMPNTSDIYQEALQLCARRANAKLAIDILNIAEQRQYYLFRSEKNHILKEWLKTACNRPRLYITA